MSNNQKYIALHGGKECRPVNPFSIPNESAFSHLEYWDFEKNAPTIPLTEVMPEGETFSGEKRLQIEYKGEWVTTHLTPTDKADFHKGVHDRIAIKPLKAIEPVKEKKPGLPSVESVIYHMKNHRPEMYAKVFDEPSPNVVENKETVEQAAFRYWETEIYDKVSGMNEYDEGVRYGYLSGFETGANWQKSQSIERIVGFVLEWVAEHAEAYKLRAFFSDFDNEEDYLSVYPPDAIVCKDRIRDMKDDIINALKK